MTRERPRNISLNSQIFLLDQKGYSECNNLRSCWKGGRKEGEKEGKDGKGREEESSGLEVCAKTWKWSGDKKKIFLYKEMCPKEEGAALLVLSRS